MNGRAWKTNHFLLCTRTSCSILRIMVSTSQISVHKLEKKLKSNRLTFSDFKMMLYKEYLPPFYMVILTILGTIGFFMWPILMYINFKLSIFLCIAYYSWVVYDLPTLRKESRRSNWFKNLSFFKCIIHYFPVRLVKTADVPAGKPSIFAVFPHGLLPFGTFYNLSTNANNFSELYPGIDLRGVSLTFFLCVPLFREFLIAVGACTGNRENIKYLLESNPPKSIILTPGGVKEMSYSQPGSKYTIVKKNRKGIMKLALETGSALVPAFTFGENNVLDRINVTNPVYTFIVEIIHKTTRGWLFVPRGRGIFQKKFGMLPQRRPITTVVGKPIPVPKVENPSPELVDEYHERFHEALRILFEENKGMYDEFGDEATLETV